MAFVVHDLENPINSIGLVASLLLHDRALSARPKPHSEATRQEVRNSTRLVFNQLDIGKGHGELRPERVSVDFDELVREIVHSSTARAEDRNPPTGGVVIVRAEDHEDDSRLLRVIDSGTGISPETRGLGLVFCRMAVEAHGAGLWVEDGAPGAAFFMRIFCGD